MSSTSSSYPYESQVPAPKGDATNSASRAASVPEPLLNSEEAAAVMKIHPKTLQKLARRGVVRGIHVGNRSERRGIKAAAVPVVGGIVMTPEPFVSAQEAAKFIGISRRFLTELARRGIAGAYPIGTGAIAQDMGLPPFGARCGNRSQERPRIPVDRRKASGRIIQSLGVPY